MKILVMGGGQDGIILSYLIAKKYNLNGLLILKVKSQDKNYYLPTREIGSFLENENYMKLENIIEEYQPTHIINTVALSSTGQCNQFKQLAMDINAKFVKKIANFVKNKDLKLIHLGSILEKEYRPNCQYTLSKIMASKFISETNNRNAFLLRLPNHESPLRDDRFFIREIIDLFQNNLESNEKIVFKINDGNTKRDWSWAPSLMNKILKMILEDNYVNNFSDLTCTLSLTEFVMCVASIFNLQQVKVICKKSGCYTSKKFLTPKIPLHTKQWIKKLILVNNDLIYDLEKWC